MCEALKMSTVCFSVFILPFLFSLSQQLCIYFIYINIDSLCLLSHPNSIHLSYIRPLIIFPLLFPNSLHTTLILIEHLPLLTLLLPQYIFLTFSSESIHYSHSPIFPDPFIPVFTLRESLFFLLSHVSFPILSSHVFANLQTWTN